MEDAPDMKVRMPADLRARIKAAADDAGRSLNAEIRMRLEWSLESGFSGQASDTMLANEIETLRAEVRGAATGFKTEIASLRRELAQLKFSNAKRGDK